MGILDRIANHDIHILSEIARVTMECRADRHPWYPREKIDDTAVAIATVIGPLPARVGEHELDRIAAALLFHEAIWRRDAVNG